MFIGVYWILKKLQWTFIGINADLPPKLVEQWTYEGATPDKL